MWQNIVGRHVRRGSRNLLLWNAAIAVAVAVFFALTARYWYNFAAGPFPVSEEEAAALTAESAADRLQYYVTVRGQNAIGLWEATLTNTKTGVKQTTAKVSALVDGDKLLIVRHPITVGAD